MDASTINMDIVHRIMYWCAKDAGESSKRWKDALPLLSVCSSWRRVGLKQLYSTMFLSDKDRKYGYYAPNFSLIMDNGYGRLVKRMVATIRDWEDATRAVVKVVGATESNCPGVDKFMEGRPEYCSDAGDDEDIDYSELGEASGFSEDGYQSDYGFHDYGDIIGTERECCLCSFYMRRQEYYYTYKECPNYDFHENASAVQTRLVKMLKEQLPNITAFDMELFWMPYISVNIYMEILIKYERQITELVYEGPPMGITLRSPNLRYLGYNYDTVCEDHDQFEVLHPELVRKIKGDDWERNYQSIFESSDGIEVIDMIDEPSDAKYRHRELENIAKKFLNIKFVIYRGASYAFDGGSWHKV